MSHLDMPTRNPGTGFFLDPPDTGVQRYTRPLPRTRAHAGAWANAERKNDPDAAHGDYQNGSKHDCWNMPPS